MSVGPMALVLLLALGAPAEEEKPMLGEFVHARGAVHSMSRADLQSELSTRQVPHGPSDSDDTLRMRLYDAKAQLLEARNKEVTHAEMVLHEAQHHSSMALLAEYSLDTLLSDDNALFSEMLRRQMLGDLKMKAAGGAVVALALTRFAPLGRIKPALLPRLAPSSKGGFLLLTVGMSALLGALQAVTHRVRVALNARSWFTQKVSAITCRDGILEWLQELDQRTRASHQRARQSRQRSSAEAPEAEAAADGDGDGGRAVWQRRGVAVPILIVSLGSSIFEEVLFRGLLLHGMITRARMPPMLAAIVSSAIFGAAHIGNEEGVAHKVIYAGWTFFGGLLFSSGYLLTRGGLFLPTFLHFANNAAVFLAALIRVAREKFLPQRDGYVQVAQRFAREAARSEAQRRRSSSEPAQARGSEGPAEKGAVEEEIARLRADNERLRGGASPIDATGEHQAVGARLSAADAARLASVLVLPPVNPG